MLGARYVPVILSAIVGTLVTIGAFFLVCFFVEKSPRV